VTLTKVSHSSRTISRHRNSDFSNKQR